MLPVSRFSVQSKMIPKLKAQILQVRYQNVSAGSGFTVERKKSKNKKSRI